MRSDKNQSAAFICPQVYPRAPAIHIGAVANALERKGIQTERGNINREIIKNNMLLEQAKEILMLAKQELHSAQYATYKSTQIKSTAVSVKYQQLETVHLSKGQKLNRLKELSKMYALFAPIQATYKESQSLKGLAKMKYDKEHKDSLSKYPE